MEPRPSVSDDEFEKIVGSILPEQKTIQNSNFFSRNKKLLIIVGTILLILYLIAQFFIQVLYIPALEEINKDMNSNSRQSS